jgi:hypothetical protein
MMLAGAIARFAGITAYGDKFHGLGFHFTDLDGWTDAPAVDMESVKRPAGHGRYVTPAYLDDRVVRMPGFYVARNLMELEHASAQFRGLISRQIRLTIEDALGTAWVDGTVTAAVFRNSGFAPEGSWSLEVTCEDPRKYGDVNDFAAGVMAINRGNFPAVPEHLVTGTSATYTINGPAGKRFIVSSGPGSGTDRIDMSTGRVYRNGALQLGVTSRADLWTVPIGLPGVTHTITAGSLVTRVTDTFV